jgi:hypothetical protein
MIEMAQAVRLWIGDEASEGEGYTSAEVDQLNLIDVDIIFETLR